MQNGYCPKCGRAAVRERVLPAQPFPTTAYVCVHCGYTERYISADKLLVIATSPEWRAVLPSPDQGALPAATGATIRLQSQHDHLQVPIQSEGSDPSDAVCPHCGSDFVIPHARFLQALAVALDQGGWNQVMWGSIKGMLYPQICGECGYTRLFLEDPARLYEAYQTAQQQK